METDMRWLKHMTATRDDERIASLIDRMGYAMETGSTKCSLRWPISKWSAALQVHPPNLSRLLADLGSEGLLTFSRDGSMIELSVPNLLKYRDEYSRKSGQSPDNVRTKIEKQIQIQKKSITKPASANPAEAQSFELQPTNGKPPKKAQLVHRGNPGWPDKKWATWVSILKADPIRQKCSGARDAYGKRVITDEDAEWMLQAHSRSNRKDLDPTSEFAPSFVGWLKSALDAMETGMRVEEFSGVSFYRPRDVI
jgi:hypothetical protein